MNEQSQSLETIAPRAAVPTNAAAQALVQRSLAEVQVAVLLAKQFPRDKVAARNAIINDCAREELASVAMYEYARGGTAITGPSIRLAEALKVAWGNMQSGWRVIGRDANQSEVEAWAWDAENNVRESVTFIIRHWRDTKSGGYALKDERDIYELCANQAARRLRACILKLIPGDVIEQAVKQCEVTLASNINLTPERIKNMMSEFEKLGVTKAQLEKKIQRNIETISGAQVVVLTKIFNSIKDGMSKASDWFEPEEEEKPTKGGDALAKKLLEKKGKEAPRAEQVAAAEYGTSPAAEAIQEMLDPAVELNDLIIAIEKAPKEERVSLFLQRSGQELFEKTGSNSKTAEVLKALGVNVIMGGANA